MRSSKHHIKEKGTLTINLFGGLFLGIFAIICILPFIMLITGSFSRNSSIIAKGYSLFPRDFTTEAYRFLFANPGQIIDAYKVTFFIVIAGTLLSLTLITMTAYVLFRTDFPYRNGIAFYFYFPTLFSGGLVAHYIWTIQYLHLKDSLFVLILSGIFNVFYTIVMRTFMTTTVPFSLVESAKIDGATDFQIYREIVMPLMKPALASIGLFMVLHYWNDWSSAMLYINTKTKFPLQYVLYRVLSSSENYARAANYTTVNVQMPTETIKLALTVVATGPIIFAYPFVQKYFVSGITIGSVKG